MKIEYFDIEVQNELGGDMAGSHRQRSGVSRMAPIR